jgi:hypothetical protein
MRRDGQMEQVRAILEDCGLKDLGFKGSKYTWNNGQQDGNFVKELLDPVVANRAWCETFKNREVWVLATRTSDHKPMMVRILNEAQSQTRFHKSFKFEVHWLADEECLGIIGDVWALGDVGNNGDMERVGMCSTREQLELCQSKLTQ